MVLDDIDYEDSDVNIQVSVRCRDYNGDKKGRVRRKCEECDADIWTSDEYIASINPEKEEVEAHPEQGVEDMDVFLCQVCGMELVMEKNSSGLAM